MHETVTVFESKHNGVLLFYAHSPQFCYRHSNIFSQYLQYDVLLYSKPLDIVKFFLFYVFKIVEQKSVVVR